MASPKLPLLPAIGKRKLLPKTESESSSASPILSVITDSGPNPKRQCISSACLPCRKRKSKCDGTTPVCTSCSSVYETECVYDLDQDNRRKGALKRQIRELQDKEALYEKAFDLIRHSDDQHVEDIFQYIREHKDDDHETILAQVAKFPKPKTPEAVPELQPSLEAEFVVDFQSKLFTDGRGESRHYGGTSNLSLLDGSDQPAAMTLPDADGRWTNVTNDKDLINHLMTLFFTWSHPWYLLFSEEIFLHGFRSGKMKYCTPLLVNAILCMGCHWSDRPEARADPHDSRTVGDHFFLEAKRLLGENDNVSTLTTVQALGLMSTHQAMNGHDSSGRRYEAQMTSMVLELGLHLASANKKYENTTQTEIEARRISFWGCFVLETAWSICIGRLTTLPLAATRLKKPLLNEHLEDNPWRPFGMDEGSVTQLEQKSYKYTILLQLSLFSEILDDILHRFYAPKESFNSRRLLQCFDRMESWYKNIPSSLGLGNSFERPVLAQVLTLHIYYHNCVINLFRPFLRLRFLDSGTATKQPYGICTESANTISHLCEIYSKTYGFKNMFFVSTHCVMSAAVIHCVLLSAHENSSLESNNNGVKDHQVALPRPKLEQVRLSEYSLLRAIQALNEMTAGQPISERFLKILCKVVKKYLRKVPAQIQAALDEFSNRSKMSDLTLQQVPNSRTTFTESPVFNHEPPSRQPPLISDADILGREGILERETRKDSAPEVVSMAPDHPHQNPSSSSFITGTQGGGGLLDGNVQAMFWAPDPDAFEGVPLAMPMNGHGRNLLNPRMDINNVLDGGGEGEVPFLYRAGFTIGDWGEEVVGGGNGGGRGVGGGGGLGLAGGVGDVYAFGGIGWDGGVGGHGAGGGHL